jgi:hypothetical protein
LFESAGEKKNGKVQKLNPINSGVDSRKYLWFNIARAVSEYTLLVIDNIIGCGILLRTALTTPRETICPKRPPAKQRKAQKITIKASLLRNIFAYARITNTTTFEKSRRNHLITHRNPPLQKLLALTNRRPGEIIREIK